MTRGGIAGVGVLLIGLAAPAEEWPGFRGPTGQGTSNEKGLPRSWGPGDNIAWRTPIPGEGWASPVVWGERVFVSTATDEGRSCRLMALGRNDGRVLWDVELYRQEKGHKLDKNSYATPTPVTDGRVVISAFNDGGLAAVTVEGRPLWVNRDVKHYSQHGLGASPVLYKGLVILAYDGSSEGPDKKLGWQTPWERSFLRALHKDSGRERWRARRGQSRIAHTTPILVRVGDRDVLVSPAGDVVQGFDPDSGERLWSLAAEGEGVVPSPVAGGGLVFTASGFGNPRLRAVRLEGGEAVRPVVWETRRTVPMIPSPVLVGPRLFVVTEGGIASGLEAATGKVLWTERLGGTFSASPVAADGNLYFLSEAGETTVVRAGPTFEVVAKNRLGETCQASPAVSGGRLFIRTQKDLVCIGPRG